MVSDTFIRNDKKIFVIDSKAVITMFTNLTTSITLKLVYSPVIH